MSHPDLVECVKTLLWRCEQAGSLAPNTGVAVALVRGSEVLLEHGFGLRDRAQRLPVTPQTTFEAGSMAKAFTAMALLLAAQEGRVRLEAPLSDAAPFLGFHPRDGMAEVAMVDVLAHRTGLPSHDLLWYFGPATTRELAGRIRHLTAIPGASRNTFAYNNLAYGLLALVFEEQLGQSWSDHIRERILEPLGMGATLLGDAPDSGEPARGYVSGVPITRKRMGAVAPAGALRTNARDLARWLRAHLASSRLLPERCRRQMASPHVAAQPLNPLLLQGLDWIEPGHSYGLGWFLGTTRGRSLLFHPAYIDGFSGCIALLPDAELGVAVLANENLSSAPGLVAGELLRVALGLADAPSHAMAIEQAEAGSGPLPKASTLKLPEGAYENDAYLVMRLVNAERGARLVYSGCEWPVVALGAGALAVTIRVFGIDLTLPLETSSEEETGFGFSLPLAMDPRVPPVSFVRLA